MSPWARRMRWAISLAAMAAAAAAMAWMFWRGLEGKDEAILVCLGLIVLLAGCNTPWMLKRSYGDDYGAAVRTLAANARRVRRGSAGCAFAFFAFILLLAAALLWACARVAAPAGAQVAWIGFGGLILAAAFGMWTAGRRLWARPPAPPPDAGE